VLFWFIYVIGGVGYQEVKTNFKWLFGFYNPNVLIFSKGRFCLLHKVSFVIKESSKGSFCLFTKVSFVIKESMEVHVDIMEMQEEALNHAYPIGWPTTQINLTILSIPSILSSLLLKMSKLSLWNDQKDLLCLEIEDFLNWMPNVRFFFF